MKLTILLAAGLSLVKAAYALDEPEVHEIDGKNVTFPVKCETHPPKIHKGWACIADPLPRYTPIFGSCGTNEKNVCHTEHSCCVSRKGWRDGLRHRYGPGVCVRAPEHAMDGSYHCVQDKPESGPIVQN